MEIRYEKHWSGWLNRDMEFKIYGSCGKPVIFIPCQAGRFWDFESFKMVDYWAPWIESGKCMVFSIDTIDNESWAAVRHVAGMANGHDQGIMTFGASMGAMHAANFYYRRPDLFDSCFAISGLYDNKEFFGDYCDELVYANCPCLYLQNMPDDHYYKGIYNSQKSLIVCGQGAWEEPLLESTRWLDTVCCRKGIHTRFEYWGYDVDHDWPWWYKMVQTYLPWFLG